MTTQTVEGAIQEAEAGLVNYQEPRIGLAGWVKGLFLDTLRGERKSGTNTQGAAGKVIARAKANMALELDFRQPYDTNQQLDPRITFSRLSTGNAPGTYWGSDGLLKEAKVNLLTYSQDITSWTKSNTTQGTATTAPDGTVTGQRLVESATTTAHWARVVASKAASPIAYCASVYLKAGERTNADVALHDSSGNGYYVRVNLSAGTVGSVTQWGAGWSSPTTPLLQSVGNGWYRLSFGATSNSAISAEIRIYCSDGSAAFDGSYLGDITKGIYIWGAQLEPGSTASQYIATQAAASAAPRIDFDPVTLECKGLLIEEQRANLLLQSGLAGGTAGTVGSGAVAPTSWAFINTGGTVTYPTTRWGTGGIRTAASGTRPAIGQSYTVATSSTYVFSFRVDAVDSGSLTVAEVCIVGGIPSGATQTYYVNGVAGSGTILKAGDFVYTALVTTTTGGSVQFRLGAGAGGAVTGDITLTMPQLELGSFPTSYIPTTTTSLTRAADSCSMTGTTSTTGTILVSHDAPSGRVLVGDGATAKLSSTAAGKTALAFNASSSSTCTNGGTVSAGGALSMGATVQLLRTTTPTYANAHVSRYVEWTTRLPDNTLKAMTT